MKLATGTLYTALDRLTGEGYVHVVNEEIMNGRARRYYALTPEGLSALRTEAAHLAEAARVVTDRASRLPTRPVAALPPAAPRLASLTVARRQARF